MAWGKKPWLLGGAVLLAAGVAVWPGLTVRRYALTSEKVTAAVKIALLTDLHGTSYGRDQGGLLRKLDQLNPDVIVMAGDMMEDSAPPAGTRILFREIGEKYPCFYVSGNHEERSGEMGAIREWVRSCGVTVLEGGGGTILAGGQPIAVYGVSDPYGRHEAAQRRWAGQLERCEAARQDNVYSVLLSHRPERAEQYAACGFDLVLSGHAHGGQVRIPGLVNGLYAPHQGLLPRYAGGQYPVGRSVMIVSRGLARNALPRVFNPPELVLVEVGPA